VRSRPTLRGGRPAKQRTSSEKPRQEPSSRPHAPLLPERPAASRPHDARHSVPWTAAIPCSRPWTHAAPCSRSRLPGARRRTLWALARRHSMPWLPAAPSGVLRPATTRSKQGPRERRAGPGLATVESGAPRLPAPTVRGKRDTRMHTATGIRTRVSAMRGRRPSPLDDSGARSTVAEASKALRTARRRRLVAGAISSLFQRHADVAELVDAHGSGPCLRNQVEVRVLSSASVLSPPGR
jgi:hypothetical protein